MGLERRWLQAVTTALAICLLSKYANANMNLFFSNGHWHFAVLLYVFHNAFNKLLIDKMQDFLLSEHSGCFPTVIKSYRAELSFELSIL